MKSFKDYLKEAEVTVKTVSPADAWKKHTNTGSKEHNVPKDPKTGKTLYQKVQGTSEGVSDLSYDAQSLITKLRRDVEEKRLKPTPEAVLAAARELAGDMEFAPQLLVKQVLGQSVAEDDDGKDKFYYQRNNIWRVMDGDDLVYEYKPERNEIVGAKKLLARFDDEGYDVDRVISPMGTVTYLYGKPEDELDEGTGGRIVVNGKEVDPTSLEVDGIHTWDAPDFSDAYFSAAYFTDGTDLTDDEMDELTSNYGDLLYDKIYDRLHESDMNVIKDRAGVKKSDVPAHKRKNSGDPDWKVSHDDLKKEREQNASGSEGLAALKKRMGMIEDGDQ